MNRVAGIGAGATLASRSKTTGKTLAAGFSVADETLPSAVQQSHAAQSVALPGMLALQEAETETLRDKAARRHGLALLEALSALQKTLLSGFADGKTEIESLAALANEMPAATAPGLVAALSEIRLRAKIELLRRGVETT